jgi:hypothetical protein
MSTRAEREQLLDALDTERWRVDRLEEALRGMVAMFYDRQDTQADMQQLLKRSIPLAEIMQGKTVRMP